MSTIQSLVKSYKHRFGIEVTTVLGCPVDCIYCPQDQLKKEGRGRKKRLSFDDFKQAILNIDTDATIHWTGYSEPCLSADLERMVQFAASCGLEQYISTTLSGNPKSVDFVINSQDFYSFQLHLPDNSGLMRGLTIDDEYVKNLRRCFETKHRQGLSSTISVICFGEDFHPLIKDIVLESRSSFGTDIGNYDRRNKIYSRAGGIDLEKMSEHGLRGFDAYYQNKNNNINSNQSFYCKTKKMNSPVLLPDGSLSICSFDYALRMTYGNLFTQKLTDIRKEWLLRFSDEFSSGKLSPCTECEHYVPYSQ